VGTGRAWKGGFGNKEKGEKLLIFPARKKKTHDGQTKPA